jgi:hypothetical protein
MKITRIAHSVKRDSCAPERAMACPLQGLAEQLGIPAQQSEGFGSSAPADQPSKAIGPKPVNLIGAGS